MDPNRNWDMGKGIVPPMNSNKGGPGSSPGLLEHRFEVPCEAPRARAPYPAYAYRSPSFA